MTSDTSFKAWAVFHYVEELSVNNDHRYWTLTFTVCGYSPELQ